MKVNNLCKNICETCILKDINLELEQGTVTAFIGPNGAGKSTLLSTMCRLLSKDSGHVLIKGKEITKWRTDELAKEIAILKQQNTYQVKMTVRELLSFGRFPYSKGRLTTEDYEVIDKVVGYLDLESYGDRYLDTLSGGQLQRAALAMILVQDTDYILLDEPLNNL
ncbi:ATP-binding cassette domain-containing protein, partial [Jeotgalibaca porci]|uniref:ATP-binding cassette domain-containing protein n=1 Tax=Jeotgalibaca porci TaxID=1868793 RepID=UPI0035A0DBF6